MVINVGFISDPSAPFGGCRHSELSHKCGRAEIDEFLETKYIGVGVR